MGHESLDIAQPTSEESGVLRRRLTRNSGDKTGGLYSLWHVQGGSSEPPASFEFKCGIMGDV